MLGGVVQDERWLLKQAVTEAATNDLFRIAHFLVKYLPKPLVILLSIFLYII